MIEQIAEGDVEHKVVFDFIAKMWETDSEKNLSILLYRAVGENWKDRGLRPL